MYSKNFILFFLFFLSSLFYKVEAETVEVDITFTLHLFDDDKGIDLVGTPVQIFEDDVLRKKLFTDEKGITKFYCKLDKEYKIKFPPQNNYVEKLIIIDTRNIDLQNWKYKKTPQVSLKYDVDVRLFMQNGECKDFSFLKEEPVMYMKYDTEYDDFHDFSTNILAEKIKEERKKKC
jgi:hypothetical protein